MILFALLSKNKTYPVYIYFIRFLREFMFLESSASRI